MHRRKETDIDFITQEISRFFYFHLILMRKTKEIFDCLKRERDVHGLHVNPCLKNEDMIWVLAN